MADRKERVTAMQDLYDKIPDIRVALKLKILAQIRAEVGQDQPIQHVHAVHVGVNIPPRAETYDLPRPASAPRRLCPTKIFHGAFPTSQYRIVYSAVLNMPKL